MSREDLSLSWKEDVAKLYGETCLRFQDWFIDVIENMSTEEFISVIVFQHPKAKLLLDITGIRAGVGPYKATWTNGVDRYKTVNGRIESWVIKSGTTRIFSKGTWVKDLIAQGFTLVPTKELAPCLKRMEKFKLPKGMTANAS